MLLPSCTKGLQFFCTTKELKMQKRQPLIVLVRARKYTTTQSTHHRTNNTQEMEKQQKKLGSHRMNTHIIKRKKVDSILVTSPKPGFRPQSRKKRTCNSISQVVQKKTTTKNVTHLYKTVEGGQNNFFISKQARQSPSFKQESVTL